MLSESYFGVKGFSHFFAPLRAVTATEGRIAFIMRDRALNSSPLVSEIVGDRSGKPRIGELVRRIGESRPIAARELVLALGASLAAAQSARKREVDRLIVADLEMQKRPVLDRPPVAAIGAACPR